MPSSRVGMARAPRRGLRFERDVEEAQRLRHPNVIDVLGAGRLEDGRPDLAMELLDGVSLAKHLT